MKIADRKQAELAKKEAADKAFDERMAARLGRSLDGDPSEHFQTLEAFLAERGR